MGNISTRKVALFTIAVGEDPIYFDSVRRYFPYNREYFGQDQTVDYFPFIDRNETMKQIAENNEKFFDFFEQLIKLSNDDLLSLNKMSNIVCQNYLNYYAKN